MPLQPGPVLVSCKGARCLALRQRRGPEASADLPGAVRRSHQGVLIGAGCLGPCHLGAFMLLGWRGRSGWVPLAGMDDPGRLAELAAWFPGSGPADCLSGLTPLPEGLRQANAECRPAAGVPPRAGGAAPDGGH